MALLAVVLGQSLKGVLEKRHLEQAREETEFIANIGVGAYLTPGQLARPLTAIQARFVDEGIKRAGPDALAVRLWGPAGVLVYASDRARRDRPPAFTGLVRSALAGRSESERIRLRGVEGLTVASPITFGKPGRPAGAIELTLRYGRIASAIQEDTNKLYAIIIAGLGLFYALLFPIVARASRELRRQAEVNEHLANHDR